VRLLPVVGVVLLAVVVTACGTEVPGVAKAAEPSTRYFEDPDRIAAEDALGELTTWNPCSVVDPDGLPESWSATRELPVAFDFCVMDVTTDDDVTAEVQVGYLYRSTHDLEEHESGQRDGGITVVPANYEEGACTRDIVFADGIALEVMSWPYEDDVDAVCEISDAVVDQVLEAVMAGRTESLQLPEDSIGEIDPCDVVTPDMLAAVPGITEDMRSSTQVAGHTCWWQSPTGETALNVEFQVGDEPVGDDEKTIQGRTTTITQYPDYEGSSLCVVDGEHIPFEHPDESGLIEFVGIWVYLKPGEVEAACTAASAIAEKLWPELPPL
jgi:hypothetical protein